MTKTFDDMPGWLFELRETSAGVYELIVHDANRQRRFSAIDTDPDALLKEGRQWVAKLKVQS
jgi:hypothetical protein